MDTDFGEREKNGAKRFPSPNYLVNLAKENVSSSKLIFGSKRKVPHNNSKVSVSTALETQRQFSFIIFSNNSV